MSIPRECQASSGGGGCGDEADVRRGVCASCTNGGEEGGTRTDEEVLYAGHLLWTFECMLRVLGLSRGPHVLEESFCTEFSDRRPLDPGEVPFSERCRCAEA